MNILWDPEGYIKYMRDDFEELEKKENNLKTEEEEEEAKTNGAIAQFQQTNSIIHISHLNETEII